MKIAKMRHCCHCGEELGVYADYDRQDTCGARECNRFIADEIAQERQDAHEQLDRDGGWQ